MLARMLEKLGLFVGWRKERNHEALFFLHLNEWLLRQSGGAWDHPAPIRYLLENKGVRTLVVDYIRFLTKTPHVISFLGFPRYLRYRSPVNLDIPWGWKDPRNTFTLPLWLELFPEAKVIHIYRHGVDVAQSLRARCEKVLATSSRAYEKRKLVYWLRPKRGGFVDTFRCASLAGGFSLWEEYIREARAHVLALGKRATEVKYEDFLAKPHGTLNNLIEFVGLDVDDMAIQMVVEQVESRRAYAYRESAELRSFAERVAERLKIYGYTA